MTTTYKTIGVMSGSSLDGVDLAYCHFEEENGQWKFDILQAETIPFPPKWELRLSKLVMQNAVTFIKTHTFLGHYLGDMINDFINRHHLQSEVDFIASHGHTVFHDPKNLFTSQIGDGAAISAKTRLPVVCDFRTCDVALEGEGAPIVPIGDIHLFGGHRFCLNLGGIANISCKVNPEKIVAYDICGANMVLNQWANELNVDYDKDGHIAASGEIDPYLLEDLNRSLYYRKSYPKSLGNDWVRDVFLPLFHRSDAPVEDFLRTAVEHIAIQIAKDIKHIYKREGITHDKDLQDSMLVTGGGALNVFLMQRIADHAPVEVVIPNRKVVEFKEALIMGFIGVLRMRKEVNCLSSVTGAKADTIGGCIYEAF
ncbi:MAG: anhydro-N-acetylmuramic acid kinase [Chitinophagales bacterium]